MNLLLKLTSFAVVALSANAHELVAPAAVSTDASSNSNDKAEPSGNLRASKLEGVLEALDYVTEEVEDLYEEQLDEDGEGEEMIAARLGNAQCVDKDNRCDFWASKGACEGSTLVRCCKSCRGVERTPAPSPSSDDETPAPSPSSVDETPAPSPTPASSRCTRSEKRMGSRAVRRVFVDMGEDCADTIGRGSAFQKEVRRMANRDFPMDTRRNRRNNRCARQGIDEEVQAVEKECLHDDTEVCEDLAIFAAEQIVDRHQKCSRSDFGANSHGNEPERNFRRECRQLAQDLCRGETRAIYREVCRESPNGTLSRTMMDECDSEVRKILRNNEDMDAVASA